MTTPQEQLNKALLAMLAAGGRPPCRLPGALDRWTSDSAAIRAEAAVECHGCSILDECAAAADANQERWHVWAGVDRGVRMEGQNPMTDNSTIPHAARCQRRAAPVLVAGWRGSPLYLCPSCGRTAPAPAPTPTPPRR